MKIKLINPVQQIYDPLYGYYNNKNGSSESALTRLPFVKKSVLYNALKRTPLPPVNLALLAALCPADAEVTIEDERVKPLVFDEKVDIVGITTMTATSARAYEIASIYRKKGVTAVMGGMHASTCTEEALQYADAVVVGEGEYAWPELLKDFKNKRLKKTYQSDSTVDPSDIPIPRYDLLNKDDYYLWTIQTTRGCPHDCTFCSVKTFFGKKYRKRPVQNVVEEVKIVKEFAYDPGLGRPLLFFSDDNITGSPSYAAKLFQELAPLGIYWGSQCTIAAGRDDALMKLAYESGCVGLLIGYESFSGAVLAEAEKSVNKPERYQEFTENIRKHGIGVYGAFVFGFDADTRESLETAIAFAKKHTDFCVFSALCPYPGTRLYEKLKKGNRLQVEKWWDKENLEFFGKSNSYIIKHPTLNGDNLFEVYEKYFTLPGIIKRFLSAPRRTRLLYLALNLIHYAGVKRTKRKAFFKKK